MAILEKSSFLELWEKLSLSRNEGNERCLLCFLGAHPINIGDS